MNICSIIDDLAKAKVENRNEDILTLSKKLSALDPRNIKWMTYIFNALKKLGTLNDDMVFYVNTAFIIAWMGTRFTVYI